MKCKNLKIKSKKGTKSRYCKLHDKDVSVFCNECPFEVKYDVDKFKKSNNNQIKRTTINQQRNNRKIKPIKQRSNKLAKAERGRTSIIYQDMTKCAVCGRLATEINEAFEGAYRQASIKYGMCMPMCHDCHYRFHNDREFALYFKRLFQDKFIELYSYELFMSVFKMDYHYRK